MYLDCKVVYRLRVEFPRKVEVPTDCGNFCVTLYLYRYLLFMTSPNVFEYTWYKIIYKYD